MTWAGWSIPTAGLVADREGSMARVSLALECSRVKEAKLEPSLEFLISSSVKIEIDDADRAVVKPLGLFLILS